MDCYKTSRIGSDRVGFKAWFTCRVFRGRRPWNRKRCRRLGRRSRSSATGRRGTCRRGFHAPASPPPRTRRCRPSYRRRRRRLHNNKPLRHRYARRVFPVTWRRRESARGGIKLLSSRSATEWTRARRTDTTDVLLILHLEHDRRTADVAFDDSQTHTDTDSSSGVRPQPPDLFITTSP